MGKQAPATPGRRLRPAKGKTAGVLHQADDWAPNLQKSKAYEQILLDIILGVLAPGARLDELGLARQYNLGVAGVREALARLSLEGLVQRRPRSATLVTSIDIQEVQQAYEVRCLLEPHAAFLAAQHATPACVKGMLSAFEGAEDAADRRDFPAIIAMDRKFHHAVALASHNYSLARIVIALHNKAARYWYHAMTTRPDEDQLEDIANHRIVADAIARGDGPTAMKAMLVVMSGKNAS